MDSFAPPRVTEQRNLMREAHRKLCADVAEGGALSIKKTTYETMSITDQGEVPQQQTQRMVFGHDGVMMESLQAGDPNLIAIADFDPPPSHQSQMLKLFVGEIVTVLGQDGRGWWYGKKTNGMQGWFPPSYVQLKEETLPTFKEARQKVVEHKEKRDFFEAVQKQQEAFKEAFIQKQEAFMKAAAEAAAAATRSAKKLLVSARSLPSPTQRMPPSQKQPSRRPEP